MWQCRKIYCNMLLLSVMLFTLCGVVRPMTALQFGGELTLRAPEQRVEFCWQNQAGGVVYRGQQVTVFFANDFLSVLPEEERGLFCAVGFARKIFEKSSPDIAANYRLPDGRSPPDKVG